MCNVRIFRISCFIAIVAIMSAVASASVLGGIPGGDFSSPNFDGGVAIQDFPGQGSWTHYYGANAATTIVGSGDARHAEMWTEWFVRGAGLWYTSTEPTSTDAQWKVSADLKTDVYNSAAHKYFVVTHDTTLDVFDIFMDFNGDVSNSMYPVQWTAGTKSGTYYASTSILNNYATASIEYDPVTGLATGKIGNETVFNETIASGIVAQTIYFGKIQSTYGDQGIFSVDNVIATPEPATLAMLGLGALVGMRRKRK